MRQYFGFFFFHFLFLIFFLRERGEGQREKGGQTIRSGLCADSIEPDVGSQTHKLQDHDVGGSRMLNPLRQLGTPPSLSFLMAPILVPFLLAQLLTTDVVYICGHFLKLLREITFSILK